MSDEKKEEKKTPSFRTYHSKRKVEAREVEEGETVVTSHGPFTAGEDQVLVQWDEGESSIVSREWFDDNFSPEGNDKKN